jgi:hypothetical protein
MIDELPFKVVRGNGTDEVLARAKDRPDLSERPCSILVN